MQKLYCMFFIEEKKKKTKQNNKTWERGHTEGEKEKQIWSSFEVTWINWLKTNPQWGKGIEFSYQSLL